MKYKQKLNVLLTTLLNGKVSADILAHTFKEKTRNATREPYLLGGRVADVQADTLVQTEMPIVAKQIDESQETTKPTPNMDPEIPIETIREAKALAEKFLSSKEPVTTDNLKTPVEMLAYGHYLSFTDGGWSDLRLPVLPEELKKMKVIEPNWEALGELIRSEGSPQITKPGLASPILPLEKAAPIVEAPPVAAPLRMANGGSLYRQTRVQKAKRRRTLRNKKV
jgi:hypothetical protein